MAVNKSTNIEIENETFAGEILELSPSILNNSINTEEDGTLL